MKKSILILIAVVLMIFLGVASVMAEDSGFATGTDLLPTDEPDFPEEEKSILKEIVNSSETIDGDLTHADRDRDIVAVCVTGNDGRENTVTINGSVRSSGETDHLAHQNSEAISLSVSGEDSKVVMTVNGNVTALNYWTAGETENLDDTALSIGVEEGGTADVTINGDIYANAYYYDGAEDGYTWSCGGGVYNYGGEITLTINGDVTADSDFTGLGFNAKNEADYGNTLIIVNGDVSGTTVSLRTSNYSLGSDLMEIVVDGTVRSTSEGIVIEGDNPDNVLITAWQIEPNDAGNLITDFDAMDEESAYENEKAAEKKLQYIIRIADDSLPYISTDARSYRDYQVAREGETVILQIAPPDGWEIESVFGQGNDRMELTRNEDGNYFLTVPFGGGVLLSVNMKETSKTKPTQKDTNTESAEKLLVIRDITDTVELIFFSDGTYTAAGFPDNHTEHGRFLLKDGATVLVRDTEDTEMAITETEDGYVLLYTAADDAQTYEFRLEEKDEQILARNRM